MIRSRSQERVLIVAAHPDDELLGAGGTAARHAEDGASVQCVIVAEGATSRGKSEGNVVAELREHAAQASAAIGLPPPVMLGLPDNRLDGLDLLDVVQPLERLFKELRPTTIYTHHMGDLNIDHQVVCRAVMTACRPMPDHETTKIFTFETVSSTEWMAPNPGHMFQPRLFVDITRTISAKLAALKVYTTEMREFPHARSLEAVDALSRWRGASIGVAHAEAFDIMRIVERD